MAQKRKPNGVMDIARIAGVSTATVSRVLNRNPSVKHELKERVDRGGQAGSTTSPEPAPSSSNAR